MRSVIAARARSVGAALPLIPLITPLLVHGWPAAHGDDNVPAKASSAELAKAIYDGAPKAIRSQLDGGADLHARDVDGKTPLMLAAVYTGSEFVELLLKWGADMNVSNKLGVTPVVRAATIYEKAKLLIDAGAVVRLRLSATTSFSLRRPRELMDSPGATPSR